MNYSFNNIDLNKESLHVRVKRLMRALINDSQPEYLPSERELQRRLGVSRTTIRKALQELELERRIMAVHGKGYRVLYQTPGAELTGRIGIVMVNQPDDYLNQIFYRLIDFIFSKGFEPVVTVVEPNYENPAEKLSRLVADTDGLICYSALLGIPGVYDNLKSDWHRLVAFPYTVWEDCKTAYVTAEVFDGFKNLTNHLLRNGHRKIALFSSDQPRIDGYLQAFELAGLEPDRELIFDCGGYRHMGYEMFGRLLDSGREFTAVMCQNDPCALGVIERCFKGGLSIPEDVSITGFDNIMQSGLYPVPLTTAGIDVGRICRSALEILLEGIRSGVVQEPCMANSELVLRASVKKL